MNALPPLPALRHLGDLAAIRPCIVVDTREQTPLPIRRLPVTRAGLLTGDYSVAGLEDLFAVERKSITDLVACCAGENRKRFERELHRLRGFCFKRLLIIGERQTIEQGEYRSEIRPAAVLASLAAWEVRFDIPVVFAPSPEAAGQLAESWAFWFAREHVRNINALWRGNRHATAAGHPARESAE